MKKRCWKGYAPVKGKKPYSKGSCRKVRRNPSPSAARLRRQAEIMEMDERLVPSTMTYEDIKDDPKLIAYYKKIMTPIAWKQLVDDWIRSGVTDPARRGFVIPKQSEYQRMVSQNPSCGVNMNGRKADKIANKTRGVDVFVFMKDKFAYSEAEDDIDKISRKNKGRDIGGGTDMRTGLREKQYYFRSNGDATRFIKMVKKLGVMKSYRASYADSADEWPYKSKPIRLNPVPAGYHTMPDGRVMADSAHTKNPPPMFKSGGFIVVRTYKNGQQDFSKHLETIKEANQFKKYFLKQDEQNMLYRGTRLLQSVEILPHTEVLRNPAQSDPNLAYKKEYGWTFVEFLRKRLIPDLRESGMSATIADYQKGITFYNDKKGYLPLTQYMSYLKYLRETLIPDLKESGNDLTAADFERVYKMVLYTIDRHPKSRSR